MDSLSSNIESWTFVYPPHWVLNHTMVLVCYKPQNNQVFVFNSCNNFRLTLCLCLCDNTNVDGRSRYVVKYVNNNIMSTVLMGRIKTATYLHLVSELLYNIYLTSGRRLTYWNFVHVQAFRVRVTYILWLNRIQVRGTLGVRLSWLQVRATLGVGLTQPRRMLEITALANWVVGCK